MKLLLVGMGPGIGFSIAKRFGKEGFEIVMLARKQEKLEGLAAQLADLGIKSQAYSVDLSDARLFAVQIQTIVDAHPDINFLHYNASAFNPAKPSEMDLETFLTDFNVNVTGAMLSAKAVLPLLQARKGGTIFLTGGGTGLKAPAVLSSLGVGKAGMRNFVFSLADECKPLGIHVATVTVCGMVQAGTKYDPDTVADLFWGLYQQDPDAWETEIVL